MGSLHAPCPFTLPSISNVDVRCCILSPLFDACDERCSIPFASIREHARVVLHCSVLVHPLKKWRRNLFVYLLFVKTLEFYILIILYNIVDLISCIDFNRFTARYINTVLFFFFHYRIKLNRSQARECCYTRLEVKLIGGIRRIGALIDTMIYLRRNNSVHAPRKHGSKSKFTGTIIRR